MEAKRLALTTLGRMLQARAYRFVAVTPATHCRVLDRPEGPTTLESIFGWNRPFDHEAVEEDIFELLEDTEVLEAISGRYKSKLRFATIGDLLFALWLSNRSGRGFFETGHVSLRAAIADFACRSRETRSTEACGCRLRQRGRRSHCRPSTRTYDSGHSRQQ
jgi:hypothetical protein